MIVTEVGVNELPHSFLQTAVYVPAPTTLGLVKLPSDQITVPLVQLAVKVVVSVPQSTVLPGVITGDDGNVPVPITIGVDDNEDPQVLIHVAV